MPTAFWINLLVFGPLLVSGLLLPGYLLGRIVRSPAPWLSAFLGSAVLLFYLVLGLDACRVPLGPTSLAVGLAALNGLLFLLARKSPVTAALVQAHAARNAEHPPGSDKPDASHFSGNAGLGSLDRSPEATPVAAVYDRRNKVVSPPCPVGAHRAPLQSPVSTDVMSTALQRAKTEIRGCPSRPRDTDWLWLLAAGIGLASVAVRAVLEPLSGWDNLFRWDFLARQMLRLGTLSFYPPMTADDFLRYGWCDGIPPLVPILNFWSYLSAGQAAAVVTAPLVVSEAALLFYAVGRLAGGLWGGSAAWPARAVLATSALLLWGVAMGQETGLTALTLVAMFVFLDEYRHSGDPADLFWAGLAAGAGALSREYGLVWPVLGLIALAGQGGLRTGWRVFSATAVAVAAPWYLRNWYLTGNPLFSHDLAGLFPVNAVHAEYARFTARHFGIRVNLELIPALLLMLVTCAGLLGGLAVWGVWQKRRSAAPLTVGIAVAGVLWLWSVGQTSGGWYYSTRVLTPALALAAVLAGAALGRLTGRLRRIAACGLLLFAGDAAFRALYLPNDPTPSAPVLVSGQWREYGRILAARSALPWWDGLVARAGASGIVVDHPANFALLAGRGARVIPLMSPQVAFLFDDRLSFTEALARCRQAGVRFFILPNIVLNTETLVPQHPFFRELCGRHEPAFVFQGMHVYDLDRISP